MDLKGVCCEEERSLEVIRVSNKYYTSVINTTFVLYTMVYM